MSQRTSRLLTIVVAALLLLPSCRQNDGSPGWPGEFFQSPDGKETVKLIDAERAEVQLASSTDLLAATYRTESKDGARVVVTLPDASLKTYALNQQGNLVSPDTGAVLKRVPL